jgi:hypothetical protein
MGHYNNEDIAKSSGFDLGGAADDDDDDASHYTSLTLQLQSAAVKAVAHVKSHRPLMRQFL